MESKGLAVELVDLIKEYFKENLEFANFILAKEERALTFLKEINCD